MNHTFVSFTGYSLPTIYKPILIIAGLFLMVTVVFFPVGVVVFAFGISREGTTCPDCKKELCITRGTNSYLCRYCQAPVMKRNNIFRLAK